jgi:hypothetical protein
VHEVGLSGVNAEDAIEAARDAAVSRGECICQAATDLYNVWQAGRIATAVRALNDLQDAVDSLIASISQALSRAKRDAVRDFKAGLRRSWWDR